MALISLALLLVVGGPLYFLIYQLDKNYLDYSTNLMETTSNLIYQSIYDGMLRNDKKAIQRNLDSFSLEPHIETLRIFTPSGQILYSTKRNEIGNDITKLNQPFLSNFKSKSQPESFYKNENTYSHLHPIYVQQECMACHVNQGEMIAVMDVELGLSQSEQFYSSAKNLTIFSAILIVVILWITLNLLYQGQIESRLKIIIDGFNHLAKGDLNTKIDMPGRHELAALSRKFNQTVRNLRNSKAKEHQYVQEKLERADRLVTLGEVAAEIAHEVNNPASIILTRAELLKDEIEENSNDPAKIAELNIIINQTNKIADITRSILHYARKLPKEFSEVDLNLIINNSLKILSPRIKKRNVQVDFKQYKNGAFIQANAHQLEQVFCNLINNSLDVVNIDEGKIEIEIQYEENYHNSKFYKIFIMDNGPGIPKEYHEAVFTPFFTTKGEGKGTGLGLFIVKNIITNHNGKIYLLDIENNGTTFIIELRNDGREN
jgi:C4-dicarboxylate-specific signal transduction histidine kinase